MDESKIKKRVEANELDICRDKRDIFIRKLWQVLNDLSVIEGVEGFKDEDLDLWTRITNHSAIQNRRNT